MPPDHITFSGFTLDLDRGRLFDAGNREILLRRKSLDLLAYLALNAGRVISKGELINATWQNVSVTDDSLTQCISDIRRKLGDGDQKLIRTVSRRGYMLSAESAPRSALDTMGGPGSTEPKPSIAVLPFETEDADQEWFSSGIAEDITTALAKSRRLLVVSKSYSFAFRGRGLRGGEIARELGVRYLLEGSIRLSGERVRVSIRLIEAGTGELLWAQRFDREIADIFTIQDEITEAVVWHLELELLPEERRAIQQTRTDSIEAYHYELRGRQLALDLTKPYLVLARRMFTKAIELDPGYARAYAGMVLCDCYLRDWHGEDIAADAILSLADEALRLDASLPEAHAARGFALFCDEKYEDAELAYRRALSIDPNSYDANFLSGETLGRVLGDRERVVSTFKLTTRLRPDDCFSPMQVASFMAMDDPERPRWARICFERAERAASLHPENAAPLHRGALALAYLGERKKAHSWLARALAIDPDDFVTQYNAACMYSVLREVEEAVRYLERAVGGSVSQNVLERIRHEADFDAIRDHPRFLQLLRSLGL